MTDQEIIINAVQLARRVMSERCDPQGLSKTETLRQLFRILDNDEVHQALLRLDRRNTFRVVSIDPHG